MEYSGNLFVVAAPSGAGKSSLVNALMEMDSKLAHSVSHTTRAPRGQEVHGREYYFASHTQFDQMVEQGSFLEWAQVHGNRYGTSKHAVEERIRQGHDIILEIDYQGALQVKRIFPMATLIFILPPSWDELRSRLQRRGEDSPEVIETRIQNAFQEVAQVPKFDFVIINERFDSALFDLKSIVHAQRLQYSAQRRAKAAVFLALDIL